MLRLHIENTLDREEKTMAEWQTVRLGEIVKTNQSTYSPKENWQFVNYLDTGNITMNKIDEIQNINTAKDKLPSRARRKVKTNSIIYSTVRPNQLHYGIIKKQPDNFLVSTGFTVIDVNYDKAVPDFIYYALTKQEVTEQLQAIAEQSVSAYPSLKPSDIENLELMLPDKETQERIVAILRSIDKKIKENNAINNNLEQQAKTLFKSWFVDFEPFDESFVDSPIGTKIPHSLQMVQIGSLSHILETGKRPKGGAVATGVPSIGAENVKRLGEVNFASAKYIPVEFAQKMDKGKVHGYELMLYKDGGKPGTFIPHFSMFGEGFPYDDFYINEHVFKLDFGDKGFNEFCYFYLQTDYPYNWLANNGGKAAVPGINQQDVNSIWIYHPDNPIVKEYCKWVQPIFTTILRNCSQNVKLSQLRDALLPKLMSGELDVSDIEI